MNAAPERILLAFSGGPDSVGLAATLADQNPLLGYVDHRLRGPRASRRERTAVRASARALGLELVRARVLVINGSEGAARNARYKALHAMVKKHGCAALATAHTADDRAETILATLARGTGLRGLAALRPARIIDGVLRIRPALDERRATLHKRAHALGVTLVRDPTNHSTAWARPRIRHLDLRAWACRLNEDPVPQLCALGDHAERMRTVLESRAVRLVPDACRVRLLAEGPATFPYLVEALRPAGPPLGRRAYASLRDFLRAGRTDRAHTTPGGESWRMDAQGAISVTPQRQ